MASLPRSFRSPGRRCILGLLCLFLLPVAGAEGSTSPEVSAPEPTSGRDSEPTSENAVLHHRLQNLDQQLHHLLTDIRTEASNADKARSDGWTRRDSWVRQSQDLAQHLESLQRAWFNGQQADPTSQRKIDVLRALHGNLQRALELVASEDISRVQALPAAEPVAHSPSDTHKAVPANNACSNALPLTLGQERTGTLAMATADGQNSCSAFASPDVWYRYTALTDGDVSFDSSGSSFDTTVSVHQGCPGLEANELACNDDGYGLQGAATIFLAAGQEVWVRLSSFDGPTSFDAPTHDGFSLRAAALPTVSGRVTNDASGLPLADINLRLCSRDGGFTVHTAVTSDDGSYVLGGPRSELITPDSYYVQTFGNRRSGYVDEVYDDIPRPEEAYNVCNEPEATAVELPAGVYLEGIDLALSPGGNVSGQARQADGRPVSARIHAYDQSGRSLGYTFTNVFGYYTLVGLPASNVFLHAVPRNVSDSVAYDGVSCGPSCVPTDGTPVTITSEQTTSGIDFVLPGGPTLRGTVTSEDGIPLLDAVVFAHRGDRLFSPEAVRTAMDGSYAFHDLDPVAYIVEVRAVGYETEIFDDIACGSNCDFTLGRIVDLHHADETIIDFELARDPDIQPQVNLLGTVTDRTSGAPMPDVLVNAYDPTIGRVLSNATTRFDGSFQVPVFPDRTYYLYTRGPQTHENQVLGGEVCPHYNDAGQPSRNECDPLRAVPVTPGNETLTGLAFQLAALARIEGTVTDIAGQPLADVEVLACKYTDPEICLLSGTVETLTDDQGTYSLPVPPGDHFLFFSGPIHLQVYDAAPCPNENHQPCPSAGIRSLHVESANVTGIDIQAMARGHIRGRVWDELGQPVWGNRGRVWLWSVPEQRQVAFHYLDNTGKFSFNYLLAGNHSYKIFTETPGHRDQVYDGIACEGSCPGASGELFAFTGEAVVREGVDFTLQRQPTLSGRVLDAFTGEAVHSADVRLWDVHGTFTDLSVATDGAGRFLLAGVEPGTYYLTATASGFLGLVYADISCEQAGSCSVPTILRGHPLTVAMGDDLTGLDFQLVANSSIRGRVSEALTNDGLTTTIYVFDASGRTVDTIHSSSFRDGEYRSGELPAGTYYVGAGDTHGTGLFEPKLYDGISCPHGLGQPPCEDPAVVATPVSVQPQKITHGIDLVLRPRAVGIRGSVQVAGGSALAGVRIDAWDAYSGALAGHAFTQSDGSFSLSLPPSSYFVSTHNQLGLVDEVFAGVLCPAGSALQGHCEPRLGTPVAARGVSLPSVRFSLGQRRSHQDTAGTGTHPSSSPSPRQQGSSVEGTVRNRTGQPLEGIEVERGARNGSLIDVTVTGADGRFRFSGLDAGLYVFDARSPAGSTPYVEQSFDGVDCQPRCIGSIGLDQRRGTQVPVTDDANIVGIDFRLLLGGRIEGRVFDATSGNPIGTAGVTLQPVDGSWSDSILVDALGNYQTPPLPPGLYTLTARDEAYEVQLFDRQPCPVHPEIPNRLSCDVFEGTQVRVHTGSTTQPVDFPLRPKGRIRGQVFELETGQALPRQYLRLERSGEAPIYVRTGRDGHFAFNGLASGTYYLGSDLDGPQGQQPSDYANVLYQGLTCRQPCDFAKGTPINIDTLSDVRIDLHLPRLPLRLFGSVRNAASRAPLSGVEIEVYNAAGTLVTSTTTQPNGSYRLDVPPGEYRLSTHNILGFLDQAYPGVECADSCEPTAGTLLTIDFETGKRADFELRSVLTP